MEYLKPGETAKILKVSKQSLRKWEQKGYLESIKTPGGHRRYRILKNNDDTTRHKIVYARVSSSKQKEDLERQIKYLQASYPEYEVISDIGSGINFNRKGFKKILELLINRHIEEVVVAHKDRFSRFGFEMFRWLFQLSGAKLVVSKQEEMQSKNEELAEDILSIITSFTARYHGSRKYQEIEKPD